MVCGLAILLVAAAPAPAADPTASLHRVVDAARQELKRQGADPSDIGARAAELGFDPARICAFVRDSIRVEPYAGSLRGARGTLIAGAGNPLDRALLLQALLESAGHAARVVSGELPQARAAEIVAAFLHAPAGGASPSPEPGGEAWKTAAAEIAARADLPPGQVEEMLGRVAAEGEVLTRTLIRQETSLFESLKPRLDGAAYPPRPDAAGRREVLAERLRTHYWVQYRDPAGPEWVDFDSAFPDAVAGRRYAAAEGKPAKLGEADEHRFEFSLIYRYRSEKKLKEEVILSHEVPAASALFEPLAFSIMPAGEQIPPPSEFLALEPARRAEIILGIKKYQPVLLAGGKTFAGRPFDLEGNLFDVSDSGLIQSIEGVGGAVRGLGGLFGGGDSKPALRFEELELRLRLAGPGIGPIIRTRSLARGEDLEKPDFFPPILEAEILVQTYEIPEAYASFRILDDMVSLLGSLVDAGGAEGGIDRVLSGEIPPFPRTLLPFALARQEARARILAGRPGVAALIDAPNLFLAIHRLRLDRASGRPCTAGRGCLRRVIDIVENRVAFVPKDDGAAASAVEASLRQGIADTVLEAALVGSANPEAPVESASGIFERAILEGRPLAVIAPSDEAGLRAAGLPAADIAWIGRNEPSSSRLIVAEGVTDAPAWWSVAEDGSCVGRIRGGYGGSTSEYVLLTLKVAGWGLCLYETGSLIHDPSPAKGIGVAFCIFLGTKSVAFLFMKYHGWLAWAVVATELAAFGAGLAAH
ncbi:MAG: transglutaminase domain-containing protein [Planctomycetes bacterium]|nr:transglutaminase domain-containing protein [Planctomycetota bacterium]